MTIEVSIDVDARKAKVHVPDFVESTGEAIINPHSGQPSRARIDLPGGFEYSLAEMGNGTTKAQAGITLNLSNTYGQFNVLHMNQDGVIRA